MGDDENETGESTLIVSANEIEYESDETIADLIGQIFGLVHGKRKDVKLLRAITEDLRELVDSNNEFDAARVDTPLSALDLPKGWTVESADDDGEDE